MSAGTYSSLSSLQKQLDVCTSDPLLSPLHHSKRKSSDSLINDPIGNVNKLMDHFCHDFSQLSLELLK